MLGVILFVVVGFVNTVDTAPTMDVDKKVEELSQYQPSSKQLFKFTCTPSPGCTVSIIKKQPDNPCGNCFQIYLCAGVTHGEYCLQYLSGQGSLNPRVAPRYVFTVQAVQSSTNEVLSFPVEARIIPNNPPYFDYGGNMSTTIRVDNAKSVDAGEVLGQINTVDDNGDALTFTMTTVPLIEGIVLDRFTGALRSTTDLKSVCYSGFTGLVKVSDGKNAEVGPFLLNVELQYANDPPIINNLNTEIFVREDEAIDNNVFRLAAIDDTTYNSIIYTVSANPKAGENLFEIKNNNLKVKETLDYEGEVQVVTLTIQASDGFCKSPTYTLKVNIADVNEPPVITPADQSIETSEGRVTLTPTWNVTDQDKNDSYVFRKILPNKQGWFAIDERTGVITTTVDYDVDGSKNQVVTEVLTVVVEDRRGLTGTATVSVRFSNINDNAPYFTQGGVSFEVGDCLYLGTEIGDVPPAVDADGDSITYSGAASGVKVLPSGKMILTASFKTGQVERFPVYATDDGTNPGPLKSKNPAWVTLYGKKCLTTPAPTTTEATTIDPRNTTTTTQTTTTTTTPTPKPTTSRNIAEFGGLSEDWVIGAIVVGVVLGLLSLFMLVKYGVPAMRRSCGKGRSPARTNRQPPPRKHGRIGNRPPRHHGPPPSPVTNRPPKDRPPFVDKYRNGPPGAHNNPAFMGPNGNPEPFGGPNGNPGPFGGPNGNPGPFGGPNGNPGPFGGPNGNAGPFNGPGGNGGPLGGPAGPGGPGGPSGPPPEPYDDFWK